MAVPAPARRWVLAAAVLLVAFGVHVLALSPTGVFNVDEEAVRAQADRWLDDGWVAPTAPGLPDDLGRGFHPIENSIEVPDGMAPYHKKPFLPLAVGVGVEGLGERGARVPGALAGVSLALALGVVVERLRPGRGPVAAVVAGVATPIWFHGPVVWGHLPGLLGGVVAVLGGWTVLRGRPWVGSLVVAAGVVVSTSFRTDGAVHAAGLAAVAGWLTIRGLWCRWRRPSADHSRFTEVIRPGWIAVAASVGVVVSLALEARILVALGGAAGGAEVAAATDTGFADRLDLAVRLLLGPLGDGSWVTPTRVFAACGFAVAGGLVGRGTAAVSPALVALVLGGVAATATVPASGLLGATPLVALALGHLVGRRLDPARVPLDAASVLLLAPSLVHVVVVLPIAHPSGGGGDWGARYLAYALVGLVPWGFVVVTDLLEAHHGRTPTVGPPRSPRIVAVAPIVVGLLLSVGMTRSLHTSFETSDDVRAEVVRAAEVAVDGGADVVVVTDGRLGRVVWRDIDRLPIVLAPGDDRVEVASIVAGTDAEVAVLAVSAPDDGWERRGEPGPLGLGAWFPAG